MFTIYCVLDYKVLLLYYVVNLKLLLNCIYAKCCTVYTLTALNMCFSGHLVSGLYYGGDDPWQCHVSRH